MRFSDPLQGHRLGFKAALDMLGKRRGHGFEAFCHAGFGEERLAFVQVGIMSGRRRLGCDVRWRVRTVQPYIEG